MAITAEETEFVRRCGVAADDLAELMALGEDLKAIWNARTYLTNITGTELSEIPVDHSAADLANFITLLGALIDFRDGGSAIPQVDRKGVLHAVRKISP